MIKIDLDRQIGAIDPNIYGAFVEPIRTVVYGSIYDPSSPLSDENGFRKDFIQLIRELKIPVLRWPGGNFVSGYNWEDGIGPKEQRPARLDLAWHQVESNQMGTDEYVKLIQPYRSREFHLYQRRHRHARPGAALGGILQCRKRNILFRPAKKVWK